MSQRTFPYAARWWALAVYFTVIAGGAVVSASASNWFVAVPAQVGTVAGMFIAGFCYRERLGQLNRVPRWRLFRRMLR